MEPIPKFVVAEAPRDYHLQNEPIPVVPEGAIQLYANGGAPQQTTITETNLDYKEEYGKVLAKATEFEKRYKDAHQQLIRFESLLPDLKNEFHGLTGKALDIGKLVFERLHTLLSAHVDITEVPGMGHNWFKFGKWMAIALLGVLGMVLLATQEGLRAFISANQFVVIAIAVAVAFVVYFGRGKG